MTQIFLTEADDFEDALADLVSEFEGRGVKMDRIVQVLRDKADYHAGDHMQPFSHKQF